MTVKLALLVSSDGIALAHRQDAGHWAFVGETAFDVPDLDAAMADLRAIGEQRAGEGFASLLVLPDDQILYTSLTAPTDDPAMTAYRIEVGLEGLTPYSVSDLVYDWRALEVDRVKLAVVARETLDEARGFAESHGFNPAGFAAMPPQERFPGMPLFDLSGEAADLTFPEEGLAFGPDSWGMPEEDASDAEEDVEADAAQGAEADTEATAAPEMPEEPDAPAEEAGNDDEARRDEDAVAAQDTPPAAEAPSETSETPQAVVNDDAPEDEPEDAQGGKTATETETKAPPEASEPDTAPKAETAPPPAPSDDGDADELDPEEVLAAAAEERDAPQAPLVLEDPTLTSPVAPLTQTPRAAAPAPEPAFADDGDLPAPPSAAVLAARKASAAMQDTAPEEADTPAFSNRGSAQVPARSDGEPAGPGAEQGTALLTASSRARKAAEAEAEQKARNPLAERLTRVRDAASRTSEPQRAEPPAKSGAAEKEPKPAPRRAGDKRGLKPLLPAARGTASDPKRRLTSMAADPAKPRPVEGAQRTDAGGDGGGRRFGSLLGRGRKTGAGPAPEPLRRNVAHVSGPGRLSALGAALRNDETPHVAPSADDSPAREAPTEDRNITGGLLGRTSEASTGPSLRTGLLLTIILLILLAAIAVWSALFLPDSPVARFLGGGADDTAPAALSDAPPAAITAPPAIGELAPPDAPPATLLDTPVEPETPVADAPATADDEAAADGIVASPDPVQAPEIADTATVTQEPGPEAADVAEAQLPVPDLPAIPDGAVPSLEEARETYAEYRIWPRPPERPDLAALDSLSDLGLSTRDPAIPSLDAVALPRPSLDPAEVLPAMAPPPAFGAISPSRAAALSEPTPEGIVTAAGVRVTAGPPPVPAIPRPAAATPPPPVPSFSIEDAILGTFRPTQRPADLGAAAAPTAEPVDPLASSPTIERAAIVPQPRDPSLGAETGPTDAPAAATAASAASLFRPDPDETAAADAAQSSAAAVRSSLVPTSRPSNMAALVASAVPPERIAPPVAVEAAARAPGPAIPTSANVTRAATQENAIRLRQVNLIGVTGTASDRRALVRLPSGRFVRVGVGDRLNGGRVAAIGESTLQYVRSGRTVTLDIPG